ARQWGRLPRGRLIGQIELDVHAPLRAVNYDLRQVHVRPDGIRRLQHAAQRNQNEAMRLRIRAPQRQRSIRIALVQRREIAFDRRRYRGRVFHLRSDLGWIRSGRRDLGLRRPHGADTETDRPRIWEQDPKSHARAPLLLRYSAASCSARFDTTSAPLDQSSWISRRLVRWISRRAARVELVDWTNAYGEARRRCRWLELGQEHGRDSLSAGLSGQLFACGVGGARQGRQDRRKSHPFADRRLYLRQGAELRGPRLR